MHPVHIDCDTCSARGPACGDCVVSVLLGPPGHRAVAAVVGRHPSAARFHARARPVELVGELVGGAPLPADLDEEERRALSVLAEAGLVAHLRLVPQASPTRRAG